VHAEIGRMQLREHGLAQKRRCGRGIEVAHFVMEEPVTAPFVGSERAADHHEGRAFGDA
jgi:hypothetical protein